MSRALTVATIEKSIHTCRSQRVMLDGDLAQLYGVTTKVFNQAVKRNLSRFPADFRFQLTDAEASSLRSQSVTSKTGRGGRRYLPYVFTQEGVAMLSSVLGSKRAVAVNIEIMRTFVRLRAMVVANAEVMRRLGLIEEVVATQAAKLDKHQDETAQAFKVVFEAIQDLAAKPLPEDPPDPTVGFTLS